MDRPSRLRRLRRPGQALPEYALILALIAVICAAALIFMGNNITNMMTGLGGSMDKIQTTSGS